MYLGIFRQAMPPFTASQHHLGGNEFGSRSPERKPNCDNDNNEETSPSVVPSWEVITPGRTFLGSCHTQSQLPERLSQHARKDRIRSMAPPKKPGQQKPSLNPFKNNSKKVPDPDEEVSAMEAAPSFLPSKVVFHPRSFLFCSFFIRPLVTIPSRI